MTPEATIGRRAKIRAGLRHSGGSSHTTGVPLPVFGPRLRVWGAVKFLQKLHLGGDNCGAARVGLFFSADRSRLVRLKMPKARNLAQILKNPGFIRLDFQIVASVSTARLCSSHSGSGKNLRLLKGTVATSELCSGSLRGGAGKKQQRKNRTSLRCAACGGSPPDFVETCRDTIDCRNSGSLRKPG